MSTLATTPTTLAPPDKATARRGLLVVSVMLATLMQAIDTTIANVALPDMQGSLSATQDQAAWVLTSYIVASAIMMPLTGWLSAVLGRRRLLLVSIAGFTVASVLCGVATGIGEMVLFRILQGVFGAALVPLSQSLLLDVFPKEKHGAAMAMWGMGLMVGPILGPPLGGWLTEDYSWRWVFLINVPVGILALLGVAASVKTETTVRRPMDWTGFLLLAIGIGALQLFLDRGQSQDWLGSFEVQIELALALLGLYLYAVHWRGASHPVMDLRLFANFNFALSSALIFVVGIVLFATLALLPPYLNQLMHYPVLDVGLMLAPRGVGTMLGMMLVGRLIGRVDTRVPIVVGLLLTAYSLHDMTAMGVDVSQRSIVAIGLIQGLGLGLVFVPISTVAYSTLPAQVRTEAASLFSLMRNIGSSIGISLVITLLARNTQINHAEIGARVPGWGAEAAMLPPAWDPATAAGASALNAEVTRQAAVIGYVNDFHVMLVLTLAVIPLVLFLRGGPARGGAPTVAAEH